MFYLLLFPINYVAILYFKTTKKTKGSFFSFLVLIVEIEKEMFAGESNQKQRSEAF